jgi:26S proteasome regulatory subunit T5
MDLDGVLDEGEADMMRELENSSLEDVQMRQRLLENEIRVLRDESNRLALDLQGDKEKVKENFEKIKMNKQLPYLVGNVVEILDLKPEVRPVPHSHRPDRDREPGFPFISDDPDLTSTRRTPHLTTSQDEEEDDGANVDLDSKRQGKAVVLKTTTRQTIFLPVIGLVDGGERTRRPEKIATPPPKF